MNKIQYITIQILHSKFKNFFIVTSYLIISLIVNFNYVENMGNCLNHPVDENGAIEPRFYLTLDGIQAENRALNSNIQALTKQVVEINSQMHFNNQNHNQQLETLQNKVQELEHKISDLQDTIVEQKTLIEVQRELLAESEK